jgi:UDP-4-amino-4,6-dideoxy-N-acetyl-beta-L-altrosamine transaminase
MIPYGRQSISPADVAAVAAVLESDWLTQGPTVELFESALAERCGAAAAVAVSSGTAALHLACRALDLGPGDWLWTSPITFVASANCALYCGADVDFVDVNPRSYNLCPDALAAKLEQAELEGRLPKVLVAVHFAGQSCDMVRIAELARRYGFRVIEDACHALGGSYQGLPVGSGRHSDLTVFSFHPVKLITTGEGGMVVTDDIQLATRVRRLRSHGIAREPALLSDPDQGGWYYEVLELGYNYRLTDIQAALGLSQLGRLNGFVTRRRDLAKRYDRLLDGLPLTTQWQHPDSLSARHLYPVCLNGGAPLRRRVYEAMHAAGIGVQVHYVPVHTQPLYRARGFAPGRFPAAEAYYAGALSLPLYPDLEERAQDRVVDVLAQVL